MFAANTDPNGGRKDTTRNAEETGVFCWNLATYDLREGVNASAEWTEYGVDEFERAGLTKGWSELLRVRKSKEVNGEVEGVEEDGDSFKVPLVASSPVRFECEYYTTLRLPGNPPMGTVDIVIGRVVGVFINDAVLTDGKVDIRKTQPIARCGYFEYTVVRDTFEMKIPGNNKAILGGLEGSSSVNQGIVDGRKGDIKDGLSTYADRYSE